ncbi:polycystin-1-like protein 2 [Hoplias malabaricus]|uniref:polycystin-1-like protein 2 n=1 Tax=Hoplias malabaricus TaxID=27720 RepID=UPI003461C2EC
MGIHSLSTLFLLVAFRVPGGHSEILSCPEQQKAFQGSCFEFVTTQQSFFSAQSWCECAGGHLAFVQNDDTQQFLQKHLKPQLNWWLGLATTSFNLRLDSSAGLLSWIDGSKVSYSNWLQASVPSPGCGFISKQFGFQWETTSNCSAQFSFICQFESGHTLACVDHKATVKCGTGQVIEIDESFYGRNTLYYCRTSNSSSQTSSQQCSWLDTLDVVSELCNGRQVCEVAADVKSFGNPCPGLGNYLSIKYHCKYGGQSVGDKSSKDQTNGDNSSNDQSNKGSSSKDQSNGDSSSKDQSNGDNTSKDQSNGDNSSKGQSNGDNSSKDQSNGDKTSKDQSNGDNSSKGQSNGADPSKEQSNGDNSSKDKSNEDNSSKGQSNGADPSKEQSNGDNSSKDQSNGDNSSKDQSNGDNSSKGQSNGADPSKEQSNGDNSSKDQSNGDNSSKGQSNGADPSKEQSNGDNSSKDQSNGDNSSKGQSNGADPSKEQSNGDNSSKDQSNGDNSSKGQSNGADPSKDQSSKDTPSKDHSNGDNSSKDQSDKNSSSKDESNGANSSKGQSNGDSSSKDQSNVNKSSKDQSNGDNPSKDQSNGDSSSKDQSNVNQSSKDQSNGDNSSKDQSNGDNSSKGQSTGDNSSKDLSNGDNSSKDQSNGDNSSKDQSNGDTSSKGQSNEDPSKDKSNGDNSSNDQSNNNNISSKDQSDKDKSSKDQSNGANTSKDQSNGKQSSKDQSNGNQSSKDQSNGDNSSKDQSNGDNSSKDQSKGADPSKGQSNGDNSSKDQLNGADSSKGQSNGDNSSKDKSNRENPSKDQSDGDNSSKGQSNGVDSSKGQSNGDNSSKVQSNKDNSSKVQSNEDKSSKKLSNEDNSPQDQSKSDHASKDQSNGTQTEQLQPPSCTIYPPFGDVLSSFNITCTMVQPFCWSGPHSFCLTTIDGSYLYCGSELGMKSLFLPLGDKSHHYSLGLNVIIKNVNGESVNTTLFTQVRDSSCDTTVEDLQSLVLQVVSQLQKQSLFSALMLIQIFQSVSSRLNRISNSKEDKDARKKLREEMLADICAALTYGGPLNVVQEVQMTAELVLSLVVQEDEMTSDAKLQACCVLSRISKSLISMSPHEGEVDALMLKAVTPIMQASSTILNVSSNTKQQSMISSLILTITDDVETVLLANRKPNQGPALLTTPLISLYVNRLSPDEFKNQTFGFEDNISASFTLPYLGLGILPPVDPVDVRMVNFKMNPFSWSEGDPISGQVAGLSLSRGNGSIIPVSNLSKEIEVLLPNSEAVVVNNTFLDLGKYNILTINLTTPNISLVLKLEPSPKASLQLYLGFQYYPNDTSYKAKIQLPQPDQPPEEMYTWVLGPKDTALEAGVYYLQVSPNIEAGVNSSNVSVVITSFAAQCKYWDQTKTNWSDYGCRVGPRTTPLVTQCLCTHLTFFGSSFFVMPNKVDVTHTAQLFATFSKNPVVVCFVCAIFLVYFLVAIWARRQDLKDIKKVKLTVLEDNDPLAEHCYLLFISTGHRTGASTSSHVTVTLTGSEWESDPHYLTDPDKAVFERGGVDVFLLTTPVPLGELQSIRLWHDNSGNHPDWYVNKVMVQYVETGQKWQFLCSSWLAIDTGECTLDKVFPVATEKDLKGFSNLFFMKTSKDLCDGHIWYSVISRPANSTFTRVQRVSCCFSLLLCTMLTSIMFWGIPTDSSELNVDVGSIKFSWKQVMIGIQSSIIMFPVNLLIVSIFRLTRPRKKNHEEETGQQQTVGSSQPEKIHPNLCPQWCNNTDITLEFIIKDLKRIVCSLSKVVKCPIPALESEKTDFNTLLSLVEEIIQQQDFALGKFGFEEAQRELCSVYRSYRRHLYKQLQNLEKELKLLGPSQFSDPQSYTQAGLQLQKMKGLLEPHLSVMSDVNSGSSPTAGSKEASKKTVKSKKKGLPWWFVFVGWFLVAATSGVSAFFTMLYGLTYGKERSISWLISMSVSFFESLLLTQPVKVFGFAIFFALVVKSVDNEEDDEYIYMVRNQVTAYSDDPDDVRISRRDSTCRYYQPPPPADVEKIKDRMIKDQKAFALILKILIHIGFLCVLLLAAYSQRDTNAYFLTQHIQKSFSSGILDSMSPEDVFAWANSTLLKSIFGQRSGFITDGNSKLVGNARLRQVRVRKDSCKTPSFMYHSIPDCHAPYSWEVEDMGSYGPGWNLSVDVNMSSTFTPWQYQNQSTLRAYPVWGSVVLYKGGGYAVDLGPDQQNASSMLQYLFDNGWLDVHTRAMFVEFTVYNANVNLFCIVTLTLETAAVGAFQYRSELQNIRLLQTTDGIQIMASEAIYFLFVLYYMFLQFKLIKQQKWKYFSNKWNLLELAIILLSWSAFSVFVKRMVQGNQDLKYYQDHRNQFSSFYETAAANSTLGYIIAFLVLLATIKMWHLMRFNSKLNRITCALQQAWTELSSLIVVIIIIFLAYAVLSNLLFGWKLNTYKTLIDAAMAMVSLQLGIFNYDEVLDLNPILGAFLIGSCIIFVLFVVLNIFISVILQAFRKERRHHKASEEEEIMDLVLMKMCSFLGIKHN